MENIVTMPAPMLKKAQTTQLSRPVRIGFIALNDAAPIIVAQEHGFFRKHGLRTELSREVGWATIRDKILSGELDAAHSPAGTVFAATLGLGCVPAPCVTGMVLNLHGNAITLSAKLWREGVRDGATLAELIRSRRDPLVFGVAFQFSSHNFLLRQWLRGHGIDPDEDVRLAVVPPPQMFPNLISGHLDGFCVGEPWNSVAVMSRQGWCVAVSGEIARNHPEKVLMVRRDFAEERAQDHVALLAALLESCRFCDQPENRERVMETLALPEYVNAPIHALRMSMSGTFDFGNGRVEKYPDFHVFSRGEANEPTGEKANWVLDQMIASGALPDQSAITATTATDAFRADIYREAAALIP